MYGIIFTLLAALLGYGIVCFAIPPLIRVTHAKKLFESNNDRKIHKNIVPTIGGVSIFIGFILASFLASDGYSLSDVKYLYPAVIIMFFIGLKDDLLILPAKKKLAVQIITAFMLATLGGFRLTSMYGILGFWEINVVVSVILSVFLIVAIINAYNFIDGVDGLASGVAIINSLAFGFFFLVLERYELSIVSFALAGSLAGFFGFNVFGKKYKLFMGDTGSLIIGTILASLMFKLFQYAPTSEIQLYTKAPALALGVMIVPAIDLIRIFFIRIMKGKSPFIPDSNHIHHKILDVFPTHLAVTLIICCVNILIIGLSHILIYSSLNINYIIGILLLCGLILLFMPLYIQKLIYKHKKAEVHFYPD